MTPVVRGFLITFLVGYVALLIGANWLGQTFLPVQLALVMENGFHLGNLWQIATYVLAQDTAPNGVLPFLISMLFFWLVVAPFEQSFGSKRTFQILIWSIFAGSLPALAVGFFLSGTLLGFGPLILGPFAAFAWAMRFRGQVSFFGVWQMQPMMMIWLVLGLSLLHFLASRNFLMLTADLGATGGGMLFIESLSRPPKRKRKQSGGRARGKLQVIRGGKDDDPPKWLN